MSMSGCARSKASGPVSATVRCCRTQSPLQAGVRAGLVHEAMLADHPELSGFDVYASGPPAMIEAIRARSAAAGLPREQLHFDSFDYAPDTLAKLGSRAAQT